MSKKTDETTTTMTTPTIEETLNAMSTAQLDDFDAVMQKYARDNQTSWLGVTPTDHSSHARFLRTMAQVGLRKPAPGANLVIEPPETSPPARTRDQVDRGYR
jgi:hypothetical protein